MHSGEEPGDEPTRPDEEEANSNYSVHELRRIHVVCSKVLQQQRCRTCTPACTTTCATNFASYLQTAKKKGKKKKTTALPPPLLLQHLCAKAHGESFPVHVTDVSHLFTKVCQFIVWDLSQIHGR